MKDVHEISNAQEEVIEDVFAIVKEEVTSTLNLCFEPGSIIEFVQLIQVEDMSKPIIDIGYAYLHSR